MIFHPQSLEGVWLIEPQPHPDHRGYFARTFCAESFAQHNLPTHWAQCSRSFNSKRHTLRGLHWQAAPYSEGKCVRCTRGRVYDVAVDLRPTSKTYLQWVGVELSADNGLQFYVPEGFAHGYLSLEDNSEIYYQMTASYHADSARGVRWNDPVFNIHWPVTHGLILSERDNTYPDFHP